MKKTILFDEKSCRWEKNKLMNVATLVAYECRLNDHFQLYGYLLLRDVYEAVCGSLCIQDLFQSGTSNNQ